jgi:hypothetical protein
VRKTIYLFRQLLYHCGETPFLSCVRQVQGDSSHWNASRIEAWWKGALSVTLQSPFITYLNFTQSFIGFRLWRISWHAPNIDLHRKWYHTVGGSMTFFHPYTKFRSNLSSNYVPCCSLKKSSVPLAGLLPAPLPPAHKLKWSFHGCEIVCEMYFSSYWKDRWWTKKWRIADAWRGSYFVPGAPGFAIPCSDKMRMTLTKKTLRRCPVQSFFFAPFFALFFDGPQRFRRSRFIFFAFAYCLKVLAGINKALEKHEGPFFFPEYSVADVVLTPCVSIYTSFATASWFHLKQSAVHLRKLVTSNVWMQVYFTTRLHDFRSNLRCAYCSL